MGCAGCGGPLTGRQRRFCSRRCADGWRRRRDRDLGRKVAVSDAAEVRRVGDAWTEMKAAERRLVLAIDSAREAGFTWLNLSQVGGVPSAAAVRGWRMRRSTEQQEIAG